MSKIDNLLRRSQKFTQTDNIYLVRGGFWLTLQKSATFLTIISAVVFANLLSKEAYGTYQYALSVLGILAISTLQSMKTAATQAAARGYEGSIYSAIKAKIKWGLLGSAGGAALSIYYLTNDNALLAAAFAMIAISLPFLTPFSLYASYLEGRKNFKLLSILNITSQVASTGTMIATVFVTKNILVILAAYLVVHSFTSFILFKFITRKLAPNQNVDPEAVPFGIKLSMIKIIPTIARELDQIFIWHFLGAAQVAIYNFAQKIPTQLSDNLSVLNELAFPRMSVKSKEELKSSLPQKVLKLYLFIVPLGILYIFAIPYIFDIFFAQYKESVFYAQLFSFFIFMFPLSLITQTFEAKRNERAIFAMSLFSSFARITLLLMLTPTLGILGVVLSRLVNSALTNILGIFLFFKK